MEIQVYKIDKNGYYVDTVIINEDEPIPDDCIDVRPPDGLYKGKFINGEWVESATQEEIEEIDNVVPTKTETEILREETEKLREEKRLSDLALLELTEILLGWEV